MAQLDLFHIRSLSHYRMQEIAKAIANEGVIKATNFKGEEVEGKIVSFWSNVPYLHKNSVIVKTWSGTCREGLMDGFESTDLMSHQRSNYYEGRPRRRIRGRVLLSIKIPVPFKFLKMDIVSETKRFCMEVYKKLRSDNPNLCKVEHDQIWKCCQVAMLESREARRGQTNKILSIVFPLTSFGSMTLFIFYSMFVLLIRSWMFLDKKGKRKSLDSIYSLWGNRMKNRRHGNYSPMNNPLNFIMYCIFLFGNPSNMALNSVIKYRGRVTGPIDYFRQHPEKIVKICNTHKLWDKLHKYNLSQRHIPSIFLRRFIDTKPKSPESKPKPLESKVAGMHLKD